MHTCNIVESYPKLQSRKGNEMILIHLFNNFDLFLYEIFTTIRWRKKINISYQAKFWIKSWDQSFTQFKQGDKEISYIYIHLESYKDRTKETSKTESENAQWEEKI